MSPILTSTLRLTASLWLAGATIAIADPANAASTDVRPQVTFQVSDLDLQGPAGRATAQRRLRSAANAVCVSGDARADQACVSQVMTSGARALDQQQAAQLAAR